MQEVQHSDGRRAESWGGGRERGLCSGPTWGRRELGRSRGLCKPIPVSTTGSGPREAAGALSDPEPASSCGLYGLDRRPSSARLGRQWETGVIFSLSLFPRFLGSSSVAVRVRRERGQELRAAGIYELRERLPLVGWGEGAPFAKTIFNFFKGGYKAMIKLRALKQAHKIEKYLSGRVASPIKVL